MIYFDSNSIYQRALQKLQQSPDWKPISNNSVISALLRSNSEIQAETARYAEYLFQESKWDSASNGSSILSMSNMLGYQPKRKQSARGKIYISADPRTHLVGKTLSSYYFEDLMENGNTEAWQQTTSSFPITSSCTITDEDGHSYVAIPTLWEANTKVKTLDIIQGQRKSVIIDIATIRATSTTSKLDPYLYIPVTIKNCEDASNPTSRAFFRVYTVSQTSNEVSYREYRVVDTLLLTNASDYDVEVYNDLYSQELFYLKFNNDPSRGRTLDISQNSSITGIRIDYIETLGEAGNVLDLFKTFTVTDITDTNGNISGLKLYGINLEAIAGGEDEETVADVKVNAPLKYIESYTAGTKEAYETAIGNMTFIINGKTTRPEKVQVYGSTEEDVNGNILPITCISFIADGIEDLVNSYDEDAYDDLEESLNYYLYRLKSPQDTLRFIPPKYTGFALGVKCRVDKDNTEDILQLEENIRTLIDNSWGSNADTLDFARNFYPSSIVKEIMNSYPEVSSVTTEVEAVVKLNWHEATRMQPKSSEDDAATIIHTMRIPFNFDKLFLGSMATKGFKDYRTGADYVMRFDFMYKKPKQMTATTNYHTTIFVQDGRDQRSEIDGEMTDAFWVMKDNSQSGIWTNKEGSTDVGLTTALNLPDYSYLSDISQLKNTQQYYYRPEVYNDNDYRALVDESSSEYIPTISTYLVSPGAIDDYLIYFSSDYEDEDATIGDGWIELTFDPLYKMLSTFSLYDSDLRASLNECSLSLLKCNNTDITDSFTVFTDLLSRYVDVYVSVRPVDPDLVIDQKETNTGNTVLYIDSYDGNSLGNNTANLTTSKRDRMISVSCEYEE